MLHYDFRHQHGQERPTVGKISAAAMRGGEIIVVAESGCKVEESRLRTAPRLVNLIATCCVVAWRIFWMTMVKRSTPAAAPTMALTQLEIDLLDQLPKQRSRARGQKSLDHYLDRIARLGGYLGRASDPPPGNIVMWRGLARLRTSPSGFQFVTTNVGNSKFVRTFTSLDEIPTVIAIADDESAVSGAPRRFSTSHDSVDENWKNDVARQLNHLEALRHRLLAGVPCSKATAKIQAAAIEAIISRVAEFEEIEAVGDVT